MAATRNRPQARGTIGWQKEWSPDLVLAHVHTLVGPGRVEGGTVAPDDDMPERHGDDSAAHRNTASQQRPEHAAVHLEHAPHDTHMATAQPHHGQQQQSQRSIR
jgi:hypothetical protein